MYYFDPSINFHKRGIDKFSEVFEFLYFFISDDLLYSCRGYSDEYLNYLEDKFSLNPKYKLQKNRINLKNYWFHEKEDWNYELTSKVKFTELLMKMNLYEHDVNLVPISEVEKKEFVYKSEFGYSGRRNYSDSKYKVCEKKLERIVDFSLYFFNNEMIFYENIIDQNNQYKGTVIDSLYSRDPFLFLCNKGVQPERVTTFLKNVDCIKREIKEDFSLDSFIYKSHEGLRVHPGCEVNIRKTFGSVLYKIGQKFFPQKTVKFCIEKFSGEICLSPKNSFFHLNAYIH